MKAINPIVRIFPLIVLLLGGCSGAGDQSAEGVDSGSQIESVEHHHHEYSVEMGELPGHSLYHLDSEWWDQHGEARPLESLAGRAQIVSMVYTNCAFACPRIVGEMKRLESMFVEEYGDRVGFVLFSIDPERDTPERLAEFAMDLRLDPARWTLLAAEESATEEMAAVLGIRYYRESPTDFAHTNMLALLDPTGQVVYRQVGISERDDQMVAEVRSLWTSTE